MAHEAKHGTRVVAYTGGAARRLRASALRWVGAMLILGPSACSKDDAQSDSDARADGSPDRGDVGDAAADSGSDDGKCTRVRIKAMIDTYYAALAARDPSKAPFSESVKYTENGKTVAIGDGLWKTAGALKFKRSVVDTESCNSVSESVVDDDGTDRVVGLRLKTEAAKITEVEAMVIHPGDYPFAANPQAIIDSMSDDWETPLPADKRATRESLTLLVDRYFKLFPAGACGFMQGCQRLENGFAPPGYDCDDLLSCDMSTDVSMISGAMSPRLRVIDVETSVAVGFAMFAGAYTDFHMFKVRDGEVVGVHATLAAAMSSGWD